MASCEHANKTRTDSRLRNCSKTAENIQLCEATPRISRAQNFMYNLSFGTMLRNHKSPFRVLFLKLSETFKHCVAPHWKYTL